MSAARETVSAEQAWAHWGAMVRACRGVLGTSDEARDCAAEALVQVLEKQPEDVRNLEAFMVTVAKRRAVDRVRSQVRERALEARVAPDMDQPDPAEAVVSRAEAAWVDAAAKELLRPEVYELVSLMAMGMTIAEVADHLGISKRSAESHLHRARAVVRAAWLKTLGLVVGVLGLRKSAASLAVAPAMAAVVAALVLAPWSQPAAPLVLDGPRQMMPHEVPDADSLQLGSRPGAAAPSLRTGSGSAAVLGRGGSARIPHPEPSPTVTELAVKVGPRGGLVVTREEHGPDSPNKVAALVDCVKHFEVSRKLIGC